MFSPIKFGTGLPTVISEPPPTGFTLDWRKGNVKQKVPNGKNPKKEPRITVGNGATGADPTSQKLAFGGTRRKGGKRSKTRRVTRRRRQSRH